MRTATITLNEKKYEITELRHRKNREWRQKLEAHISDLASSLDAGLGSEITDLGSISQLVRAVIKYGVRSTDLLCELVAEYAPSLKDALEDSYDSEITAAFVEVLKLAYPFSGVVSALKNLTSDMPQIQRS